MGKSLSLLFLIIAMVLAALWLTGCAPAPVPMPHSLRVKIKHKVEADALRLAANRLDPGGSIIIKTPQTHVVIERQKPVQPQYCSPNDPNCPSCPNRKFRNETHETVCAFCKGTGIQIHKASPYGPGGKFYCDFCKGTGKVTMDYKRIVPDPRPHSSYNLSLKSSLYVPPSCLGTYERKCGAILLPREDRVQNYAGGSCGFASTEAALKAAGKHYEAAIMRQKFAGGADLEDVVRALETVNVPYSAGRGKDGEAVVNFTHDTGRACTIFFKPMHVCTFLGFLKDGRAVVLDNNKINELEYWSPDAFWREFRRCGSAAAVPLDQPVPGRVL